MSASDKKKLRKELASAQLTEKQRKEQAEAKKLRAISVAFVVIMLVIAVTAASVLVVRTVNNSGIIDRNVIAAVAGEHQLNSVQMNYYLMDEVRNIYSQWQEAYGDSVALYASFMGIDISKPIDEQIYDEESGQTWADFFLESALEKAKSDYALYNKAMAENFTLPEDEQASLDSIITQLDLYAVYSGYKNADKYLRAIYGFGSDKASYSAYTKIATIASAYYNKNRDALTYDETKIDEYEKDKFNNYSSFSYASYYVSASSYLKGGTTDEKGNTTYSDDDRAAALAEAEKIAKELAASENMTALDQAIAALEINKDNKNAATTKNDSVMYENIPAAMQTWIADAARKDGDIGMMANESTTTDADGKETKTTNGYYVVVFLSRNDNLRLLANVRHILVAFEGGTTGSDGKKVYSETEKTKAKTEAERLLKLWQDGAATEDSFIALVKEHSDDSSASTGGLFEDIHASSPYVDSFKNWAIHADRKAGDAEIVESEYGYHVMYYVGDGELTYRDYMITEDMRAEDMEKWHKDVLKTLTITKQDTRRLNLDLVMSNM